jgi:hypothetical protein
MARRTAGGDDHRIGDVGLSFEIDFHDLFRFVFLEFVQNDGENDAAALLIGDAFERQRSFCRLANRARFSSGRVDDREGGAIALRRLLFGIQFSSPADGGPRPPYPSNLGP